LWIGKQPTSGESGDEVFDRKVIAACRGDGHEVGLFYPEQVGRLSELVNLLTGVPYYRSRFFSSRNLREIQQRFKEYDVVVCSWEPFDILVRSLRAPSIMILHNVTSRALPALFTGNFLVSLAAARAAAWERSSYRTGRFHAIGVLSRRDYDYLSALPDSPHILLLRPGMPPHRELTAEAAVLREIVILGTFEWKPKHRDILRFAKEFAALGEHVPIQADGIPAEAAELLQPFLTPSAPDSLTALRFGLITDRFEAGHKLKTLAYIADNKIVLTFADVSFDFTEIPDYEFFIRRVNSVAELVDQIDGFMRMPATLLRNRFRAFQSHCARIFTWDGVAQDLLVAAADAVGLFEKGSE
jgi:hypothetical protein